MRSLNGRIRFLALLTLILWGSLGTPIDAAPPGEKERCDRPDEAETLALIEELVIEGVAVTRASPEELAVRVAATGQDEAGETCYPLAAGDEIRTGPDTQAVLYFPNTEDGVDPWVFLDRSSSLQIVDQRSIETLLGRLFATLEGLFTVLTPQGQLGVEGTEFEVVLESGGGIEVQVLEGVAEFRPGLLEERDSASPAQLARPFWEVETAPGTRQRFDKTVPLVNVCKKKHRFTLEHDRNLRWLDFSTNQPRITIPGAGRASVDMRLTVDATGVSPGIYRDSLRLDCPACHKDCLFQPRQLPLRVLVGVGNRRIEPLQRLELRAGESTPRPEAMAEPQVRGMLDWTVGVLLAGQPTYPAPGDPPGFASREERGQTFREARFEAIWQGDARAWAEVGRVYNDWGEGRRAAAAYEDAAAREPELGDDAEFLARLAQAHRQAGRLDEAEARAREALSRQPESGHSHLALANALRTRASVAKSRGDLAAAKDNLNRSLLEYDKARRFATPQMREAVANNDARSRIQLAELAEAEDDDSTAERLLREARNQAGIARAADPQNPFALLVEGEASQKQARLDARRGNQAASRAGFEEAERQYREALAQHPDLAAAHYRLGALWVDRGPEHRERAVRAFERCLAVRPTYGPAYYRLGKLLQDEDPVRAARYLSVYQKLTPDEIEKPLPFPDLRGRPIADAQAALAKLGLRLTEVERVRSPRPPGTVIGQQPEPGADVEAGRTVKLVMAVPEGRISMPDLRNLSEAEALSRITILGLNQGKMEDKERKGQPRVVVLKQSPKAGKQAKPGSTVDLVFAVPPGAKVPDVVGVPQRAAIKKIEKRKLSVGETREQASCEPAGTVVAQSPDAGRRVPPGSGLDLVLATPGPGAQPVPKLVDRPRDQAGQLLRQVSLRGEDRHQGSERAAGTVLSQDPAPGTLLPPGCPVRLTLAKPIPLVEVPRIVGAEWSEVQSAFASRSGPVARLRLGQVRGARTDRVPVGIVLEQQPPAGSRVRAGTRIDLVVEAQAPPPPKATGVTVPQVICLPSERGAAAISKAGFQSVLKGEGEVVRQQSPAAGSRAPAGSVVTLVLGHWDEDCNLYYYR